MDSDSIKRIILEDDKISKIKKIICEKERKKKVETKTWGLDEMQLSHEMQLKYLMSDNFIDDKTKNNYIYELTTHIKNKINNYKHQDIIKNKLNKDKFVSLRETIELLRKCNMKCCYCSDDVYILYEMVREMKQWSLDRIDNDIGHNSGNLVIACLECNLKRRRTNKDKFMFTKKMIIIKEND
jgi:hypothetical protein